MTTTTKRPEHCGRWMECYDGREAMDAAHAAALEDAARACDEDEHPTADTAAEWLAAVRYAIDATGGGLAEYESRPAGDAATKIARNALIAAAYMARSTVMDVPFARYMPLDTIGHHWHHALMNLAYAAPCDYRPDWGVEQAIKREWAHKVRKSVAAVHRQWINADWAGNMKTIVEWALHEA